MRKSKNCSRFSDKEQTRSLLPVWLDGRSILRLLVVLESEYLAPREEVEHFNERQEALTILMECKIKMQKVAFGDFQMQILPGVERVGGPEDTGSAGTCTTKAQVDKMGRRKGEDVAKVGVVKGRRTVILSPRQLFFCFVLIFSGF